MGMIDISELNNPPEKHELLTAKYYSELGKNVKFLRKSNVEGVHTPDIRMDRLDWEIKSPHGKSTECICDNMRDAVKQSCNIIIDLRRMGLPTQKCIDRIRRELGYRRTIKRLQVITKENDLLILK